MYVTFSPRAVAGSDFAPELNGVSREERYENALVAEFRKITSPERIFDHTLWYPFVGRPSGASTGKSSCDEIASRATSVPSFAVAISGNTFMVARATKLKRPRSVEVCVEAARTMEPNYRRAFEGDAPTRLRVFINRH